MDALYIFDLCIDSGYGFAHVKLPIHVRKVCHVSLSSAETKDVVVGGCRCRIGDDLLITQGVDVR